MISTVVEAPGSTVALPMDTTDAADAADADTNTTIQMTATNPSSLFNLMLLPLNRIHGHVGIVS
jgi:hypothetical protein